MFNFLSVLWTVLRECDSCGPSVIDYKATSICPYIAIDEIKYTASANEYDYPDSRLVRWARKYTSKF